MKDTPQSTRRILAILAVIVGLFMIAVAPFLIQVSLERVVAGLLEAVEERPAFTSGILLFSFAYPIYRGLIFVGGIMLILLAGPINKGEEWAYPAGLLAATFPSVGGMFMFLPYITWEGGFPLPMVISVVGLTFFWLLILVGNVDKWLKWGHFLALTLAGMLATHAFVVGIGNIRMLLTRPLKPLYDGLEWWILAWSAPVQWVVFFLLLVGIYLLAARRYSGWWLMLIAASSIVAINLPAQIIRTATLDYLVGALLAAGLIFTLAFPKFKAALIEPQEQRKATLPE